jgi:hypothetical protein
MLGARHLPQGERTMTFYIINQPAAFSAEQLVLFSESGCRAEFLEHFILTGNREIGERLFDESIEKGHIAYVTLHEVTMSLQKLSLEALRLVRALEIEECTDDMLFETTAYPAWQRARSALEKINSINNSDSDDLVLYAQQAENADIEDDEGESSAE